MKIKRYKKIRKTLAFFNLSFGFKAPYKVLLDADFIATALEGRVKLRDQIPAVLQADGTKLFVTKCIVSDLEQRMQRDRFWRGPWMIAKSLPYLRCEHADMAHPNDCIKVLLKKRTDAPGAGPGNEQMSAADAARADAAAAAAEAEAAADYAEHSGHKHASDAADDEEDDDGDEEEDEEDSDSASDDENEEDGEDSSSSSSSRGNKAKPSAKPSAPSHTHAIPALPPPRAGDRVVHPASIDMSDHMRGASRQMRFNGDRLLIACQQPALRAELREIPCVPLLYFCGNVPLLEPPSEASVRYALVTKTSARGGASTSAVAMSVTQSVARRVVAQAGLDPAAALDFAAAAREGRQHLRAPRSESSAKKSSGKPGGGGANPMSRQKKKPKPLPAHMQAALEARAAREKEERARAKAVKAAAAAAGGATDETTAAADAVAEREEKRQRDRGRGRKRAHEDSADVCAGAGAGAGEGAASGAGSHGVASAAAATVSPAGKKARPAGGHDAPRDKSRDKSGNKHAPADKRGKHDKRDKGAHHKQLHGGNSGFNSGHSGQKPHQQQHHHQQQHRGSRGGTFGPMGIRTFATGEAASRALPSIGRSKLSLRKTVASIRTHAAPRTRGGDDDE